MANIFAYKQLCEANSGNQNSTPESSVSITNDIRIKMQKTWTFLDKFTWI